MSDVPVVDSRFQAIPDLPTGFAPYEFKKMYAREFTLAELKLIYVGVHSRMQPVENLVRAIQLCVSVPVVELTDGDFEFVLAWLRRASYPKGPLLVNWSCRHMNQVYKADRAFYRGPELDERQMALQGVVWEQCDTNNVETVQAYRTEIASLPDDQLVIKDARLDFPRVATLNDFHMWLEEQPWDRHMAECCRWIKRGKTFKDKYNYLMSRPDNDLYEDILEIRKKFHHGIAEVMKLRCRVCDHRWEHQAAPRILSFFADNTEEDIFKIMYSLLSEFGYQPTMTDSAKSVLFYYSSLAKDRQEAAQRKGGFKPLA